MTFPAIRVWLRLFVCYASIHSAFCQKNHIIIELDKSGFRQQVVKPGDTIAFYREDSYRKPVPVAFRENDGSGPCQSFAPDKGVCTIGSCPKQGCMTYTYYYCTNFQAIIAGECNGPETKTKLFHVRVRKNKKAEGDKFETKSVELALTSGGEIGHFVNPKAQDVVHWRDPKTHKPRTVLFKSESPCLNPVLAHSGCTVQDRHPDAIRAFDYLVCSDAAQDCDDPTLHVLGSNHGLKGPMQPPINPTGPVHLQHR
jgi:hypothetical protein